VPEITSSGPVLTMDKSTVAPNGVLIVSSLFSKTGSVTVVLTIAVFTSVSGATV